MYLYDRLLERKVRRRGTPDHVAVVVTGSEILDAGFEVLSDFLGWCSDLGVGRVSLYVSVVDSEISGIHGVFSRLDLDDIEVEFVREGHPERAETEADGGGDSGSTEDSEGLTRVKVSVGLGGRNEFVGALREMAHEVKEGELRPEDVDEETVEDHLVFKREPEMLITGNDHLSDFLIWQSVYTELYFADFSWDSLRKRDLLRAFREFQDRERRFGK